MINFDVYKTNRDLAFTAEIDCSEHHPNSWKLREAIEWAKTRDIDLTNLNLSNGDFKGMNLSSLNFQGSDFTGADFSSAQLASCDLRESNFNYAVMRFTECRNVEFNKASFWGTDLYAAKCRTSLFIECEFHEANLSEADFKYANLAGASMYDCDIKEIDLTGANVTGLKLKSKVWAPRIPNIHQKIADAVENGAKLDMTQWHCGTSHCLAGWAVTVAGDQGQILEDEIETRAAAYSIFIQSDSNITVMPDFHASNVVALQGIKERAAREARS